MLRSERKQDEKKQSAKTTFYLNKIRELKQFSNLNNLNERKGFE
jgi:hypothetical protein